MTLQATAARHIPWIFIVLVAAGCSRTRCGTEPKQTPSTTQNPTPPPTTTPERTMSIDDYHRYVYGPGKDTTFAATTATEHEVVGELVPKLYAGAIDAHPPNPTQWQAEAARAGFEIQIWTIDKQVFWALVEQRDKPRGAGAYVFRVAPPEPGPTILLEAPHEFFDEDTGMISAQLFYAPPPGIRPRALFTNTIHRYQLSPNDRARKGDKRRKNHPADVAHNPDHVYSTATRAFATAAAAYGTVRVIQIHGFSSTSDDDNGNDRSDVTMVVSAGDKSGSSPYTSAVAQALRSELDAGVRRFPEDVDFLGATTNAQNKLLRSIDHTEFLHAESSRDMRTTLKTDAAKRNTFGRILFNTK